MIRPGGIATLDIARRVGFSYARPAEQPVWGSFATAKVGGDMADQLLTFRRWLLARFEEWQPKHAWYMRPIRTSFDDTNRIERLFGMAAILRVEARERGIGCESVEDQTVVAFFCGRARFGDKTMKQADRRRLKKEAVMATCVRYGWNTEGDDDAADALAALVYAEHKLAPRLAATRGLVMRQTG